MISQTASVDIKLGKGNPRMETIPDNRSNARLLLLLMKTEK